MDKQISERFDNWSIYTQKMSELFARLNELLTDLGITKANVKIITFISSMMHGEIRFYDSHGALCTSADYLTTDDRQAAEDHLTKLFDIKKELTIFNFELHSANLNAYDEFGLIHRKHNEIYSYGIAVQSHLLEYSKIIFELMSQISSYCKKIMDDKKFEFEKYMLANLIYIALKKQIDIDFYNTLSALPYEKRIATGGILLVNETQPYELKINFKEQYPLEIKNVKQIRKLLEMATNRLLLAVKNSNAIGICDYEYCDKNSDFFIFHGHQMWSYYENSKELLSYKEGKYTFIFGDNKNFSSHFPNKFISENNYKYLNSILHEIRQQKHGTLLIISDTAHPEVERLCKLGRGYAIAPLDLKIPRSRALLASITSIDGAIFLDTNLVCYGIGIILDGIAVKTGLSSRGARYNSAQCYIDNKDFESFVAVVISDDETIDILYNKTPPEVTPSI